MDNVNVLVSVVININNVNVLLYSTEKHYHNWIFTSKLAYTSSNVNKYVSTLRTKWSILKVQKADNIVSESL